MYLAMDTALREKILLQLRSEIDKTQVSVLDNLKELEQVQGDNRFLRSVYSDYCRYRTYIVEQKRREQARMRSILDYLEKVLAESELSLTLLNRARFEQNRVLGQLDQVQGELDELVSR